MGESDSDRRRSLHRVLHHNKATNVVFREKSRSSSDWYHNLLWVSWPKFLAALFLTFLSVNLIFGSIYTLLGTSGFSGLNGESQMSMFWECFFFSVQTFSTIGYGHIAPTGFSQNIAVAIEALLGMISVAIIAGICFSRFSRPIARLVFSENAIITDYFGKQSLVFRLANARGNQIAEARLFCVFLKDIFEGERRYMRRQFDMKLLRERNIFFSGSWTVIHEIDEQSPIWKMSADDLRSANIEIVVSFSGHDTIYNSGVRGRWGYHHSEIIYDYEFEDMVGREGEKIVVDLKKISSLKKRGESS